MIDQSEYWKRVEKAARACDSLPPRLLVEMALQYIVLPSDLRKRVLEMKEEQDERTGQVV